MNNEAGLPLDRIAFRLVSTFFPQNVAASIGKGQEFGEMGLLANAPRAATVRCNDSAHLLVLSKIDYNRELRSFHAEVSCPLGVGIRNHIAEDREGCRGWLQEFIS